MKEQIADRAEYLREVEECIAMVKEDPSQSPGALKDLYCQLVHDRQAFAKMFRHTGRIQALIDWLKNPVPRPPQPQNRVYSTGSEEESSEEEEESSEE